MTDGLDRLKVLINSSTPIVVMETSEEMHAVNMVRTACRNSTCRPSSGALLTDCCTRDERAARRAKNIVAGPPSIRTQSGAKAGAARRKRESHSAPAERRRQTGSSRGIVDGTDSAAAASGTAIYNTREPVQALANMESMTVEAVFILKDFHRHMTTRS